MYIVPRIPRISKYSISNMQYILNSEKDTDNET